MFSQLLLLVAVATAARVPAITPSVKALGGTLASEQPHRIISTKDGGALMVGTTEQRPKEGANPNDADFPRSDAWIVRLSAAGAVQWQRVIGGPHLDLFDDAVELPDGGFLVAGSTRIGADPPGSPPSPVTDAWLVRFDAQGRVLWQRAYGDRSNPTADMDMSETANRIVPLRDGTFVVMGTATLCDVGKPERVCSRLPVWLMKITDQGVPVWQRLHSWDASAGGFQATPDGGFVVTGYTLLHPEAPKTFTKGALLKLDKDGRAQWERTYGGSKGNDGLFDIIPAAKGGWLAFGVNGSDARKGDSDAWAIRLGKDWGVQWQSVYGGAAVDEVRAAVSASDGSFWLAGDARPTDPMNANAWLLHLGASGAIIGQRAYGGAQYDSFQSVALDPGGKSMWVAGQSGSYTDPFAALVVHADSTGAVPGSPTMSVGTARGHASHAQAVTVPKAKIKSVDTNYSPIETKWPVRDGLAVEKELTKPR